MNGGLNLFVFCFFLPITHHGGFFSFACGATRVFVRCALDSSLLRQTSPIPFKMLAAAVASARTAGQTLDVRRSARCVLTSAKLQGSVFRMLRKTSHSDEAAQKKCGRRLAEQWKRGKVKPGSLSLDYGETWQKV